MSQVKNKRAYNKLLNLTSQHSVSLRYTLCCRSGELKRYVCKQTNYKAQKMKTLNLAIFVVGLVSLPVNYLSAQDAPLEKLKNIKPEIYYPTKESRKIDPNDKVLQGFRDRRIKDLADPKMPGPFSINDYAREETISSDVPWEDLSNIFRFKNWDALKRESPNKMAQLSKAVKARVVFASSDVKILELAVAAGGILPAFSQPGPSAYHIIEGSAEFTSGKKTANVFTGTSVKVEPGDKVRIKVTSKKPLKALWFSWAPGGDQQYLSAGYFLTGANFHIQPEEAEIPKNFEYWEKQKKHKVIGTKGKGSSAGKSLYPDAPTFRSEIDDTWLDFTGLADGGFFWADDFKKMGSLMGIVNKIVKMKGVFRATVPKKQYDFNIAYITWGPRSKYIMHSHATPEFYYILAGKTEWMLGGPDGNVYSAEPGNMYFHAPYLDHEMRGLSNKSGQVAITGSWAPNGDRSVFTKPFVLKEALPKQKKSAVFPKKDRKSVV